jgi:hypothetical protein
MSALLTLMTVLIVVALAWAVLRRPRGDETERFHRARELTTSWASGGDDVPASVPGAADADPARDRD